VREIHGAIRARVRTSRASIRVRDQGGAAALHTRSDRAMFANIIARLRSTDRLPVECSKTGTES
jgi:hypothetical protein